MVPSTQQSGGVNFIRERLKKQNWRLTLRSFFFPLKRAPNLDCSTASL
jgi:hypothetical protein